jgi:magnesium-transporting ATPase (P-type)
MCDLRSAPTALSASEAQRRLRWGPNELLCRRGRTWPRELARQLSHPLPLLLWLAATLSLAVGSYTVAIAVLLVILSNAPFASMPPVDE